MGKTFNPKKHNMVFCSVCNGKGKLPRNSNEFDVCRRCGGFGLIKDESEIFEEVENREQLGVNQIDGHGTDYNKC